MTGTSNVESILDVRRPNLTTEEMVEVDRATRC